MSRYLNAVQLLAVEKIGDVMLPGTETMPRFSKVGCIAEVDRVLETAPDSDRNDLKVLLTILGYLPMPLLRGFLGLLEKSVDWAFMPGILRMIRLALRGIVFSLYYGNPQVHERMQFKVGVYTADLKK